MTESMTAQLTLKYGGILSTAKVATTTKEKHFGIGYLTRHRRAIKMLKITGSRYLHSWLLSVEKRAFDPRMLRIESYRQLESELIDPNECQSTGERWNQENKRQECYLIDIESDRVFCLSRTSTNSRWDLDFEVDFSSVL